MRIKSYKLAIKILIDGWRCVRCKYEWAKVSGVRPGKTSACPGCGILLIAWKGVTKK